MGVCIDHYYRYEELTGLLHELAAAHPELLRLESIGKSFKGRNIWLAVVTNTGTGLDIDKPALWVDANIHSAEVVGSMTALRLLDHLLTGYGHDADVTRALDTRAFYIVPRVNPDGAEWALAEKPKLVRSSVRPYPFDEEPVGGLQIEDVDGDGRILTMRVPDPNGPWKICAEEPRLLVRRDPTEFSGQYYRLLPEGRLENYDGITVNVQPMKESLDLNRNFPARWRGEHEQRGASYAPGAEPEVRALIDFIGKHPNICSGISLHSYSGVLLRPFSFRPDEDMPAEDLWVFQRIGDKGTELTGYPNVSAYHDFRYHPQEIITGAMDDWFFEELGRFGWTVEMWSPHREAGIMEYKYIDWYREHPLEDDIKLLKWSDEQLDGTGYIDWFPFEHPDLGPVDIGGWNVLYSFWNPPANKLEKETARLSGWLVWHNLISPKLEFLDVRVNALSNDTWRIRAVAQNTGWLPTDITKHARNKSMVRGVVFEIHLPNGVELVQGEPRVVAGQLEGRSLKPSSPNGWAGQAHDITDDRCKVEWVVQGKKMSKVSLTARHERAGRIDRALTLA